MTRRMWVWILIRLKLCPGCGRRFSRHTAMQIWLCHYIYVHPFPEKKGGPNEAKVPEWWSTDTSGRIRGRNLRRLFVRYTWPNHDNPANPVTRGEKDV